MVHPSSTRRRIANPQGQPLNDGPPLMQPESLSLELEFHHTNVPELPHTPKNKGKNNLLSNFGQSSISLIKSGLSGPDYHPSQSNISDPGQRSNKEIHRLWRPKLGQFSSTTRITSPNPEYTASAFTVPLIRRPRQLDR